MVYQESKARVEVSFWEVKEDMLPILVDMIATLTGRKTQIHGKWGNGEYGDEDGGKDADVHNEQVSEEDLLHALSNTQVGWSRRNPNTIKLQQHPLWRTTMLKRNWSMHLPQQH
ncbi:hypothetical protein ACHAXS_000962 [Conticribra weissflogii]